MRALARGRCQRSGWWRRGCCRWRTGRAAQRNRQNSADRACARWGSNPRGGLLHAKEMPLPPPRTALRCLGPARNQARRSRRPARNRGECRGPSHKRRGSSRGRRGRALDGSWRAFAMHHSKVVQGHHLPGGGHHRRGSVDAQGARLSVDTRNWPTSGREGLLHTFADRVFVDRPEPRMHQNR